MEKTKLTIVDVLKMELKWHEDNQDKDKKNEFQNGFISGMKQAIDLIEKL